MKSLERLHQMLAVSGLAEIFRRQEDARPADWDVISCRNSYGPNRQNELEQRSVFAVR